MCLIGLVCTVLFLDLIPLASSVKNRKVSPSRCARPALTPADPSTLPHDRITVRIYEFSPLPFMKLSTVTNSRLLKLGETYHCSVIVNGKEWQYDVDGISPFEGELKETRKDKYIFRYDIPVETREISVQRLQNMLMKLQADGFGDTDYNLFEKNCCHFATTMLCGSGYLNVQQLTNPIERKEAPCAAIMSEFTKCADNAKNCPTLKRLFGQAMPPRKIESKSTYRFSTGDEVIWTSTDEMVPDGAVGTVVRLHGEGKGTVIVHFFSGFDIYDQEELRFHKAISVAAPTVAKIIQEFGVASDSENITELGADHNVFIRKFDPPGVLHLTGTSKDIIAADQHRIDEIIAKTDYTDLVWQEFKVEFKPGTLGISFYDGDDNRVDQVQENGQAAKNGIGHGMKLVRVQGADEESLQAGLAGQAQVTLQGLLRHLAKQQKTPFHATFAKQVPRSGSL